jgi:pentatricopeptide repeat domain-containing protein 1
MKLFEEMKAAGLKPDLVAYSTAIDACARQSKWRRATQLLAEMREAGVPPDVRCYACAIK